MRLDLLNRALVDSNINDAQFRTLYIVVNNCSMKNVGSIEMYNAFLMSKLHYSESTVKRCIKALEEQGYISVRRAAKKKTPNVITLMPAINECRNEVRNDTLNKNNNKIKENNNIQSNTDNTIQGIALHSNEVEDNGIDYDVYCEQQLAREKAMRDTLSKNVKAMTRATTETDSNGNEQQIPMQGKFNRIDWDAWRKEFEDSKTKMLNSTCKTNFDLFKMKIRESLNFAKEHMRSEKYHQVLTTYQKWFEASKPYFYYSKQNPTEATRKEFDESTWDSYICELNYSDTADERLKAAKEMLQYLRDCSRDPKTFIADLRDIHGITIS